MKNNIGKWQRNAKPYRCKRENNVHAKDIRSISCFLLSFFFFFSAFQFFLHRLRFDFIDLLTLAHMFPDFLFRSGIWFPLWRSVIVAVLLHFGFTNTYILSLNLLCAIFDVVYIRKCVCVCFGVRMFIERCSTYLWLLFFSFVSFPTWIVLNRIFCFTWRTHKKKTTKKSETRILLSLSCHLQCFEPSNIVN